MSTITQQIRELQNLTATQLSERYEDLFGKPPHVRNKAFLQRRVAWKIQELEFGGLSEPAKERLDDLIAQICDDLRKSATQLFARVAARLAA